VPRPPTICEPASSPAPFVPGEALLCTPVLAAMLVTAVNDHWLKAAAPGWLTGKLSDFAGLFFFPFLVVACLELVRELLARARGVRARRGTSARAFAVVLVVEGLLFVALEVSPAGALRFGEAWSTLFGVPARFTADPSDLCALLVLPLAWRTARARGLLAAPRAALEPRSGT
jgi:hypothetical protein